MPLFLFFTHTFYYRAHVNLTKYLLCVIIGEKKEGGLKNEEIFLFWWGLSVAGGSVFWAGLPSRRRNGDNPGCD